MKNLLILAMLTIFIFACKMENSTENQVTNQNEKILKVSHRLNKGECLGYCDTKLVIDSTEIRYIKKGWNVDEEGVWENLPTFDSTYSITQEQWNIITNLINIDEIILLDSAYHDENEIGVSEGNFEFEITTNLRSKKIMYLNKKRIEAIDSISNYLMNLREEL